jgi:hypothetical protein
MQRRTDLTQGGRAFALTAELYENYFRDAEPRKLERTATSWDGAIENAIRRRRLAEVLDRAVAEIVESQIVEAASAEDLRIWIEALVKFYFAQVRRERRRATPQQADEQLKRTKAAVGVLRQVLPVIRDFGPRKTFGDYELALQEILEHAEYAYAWQQQIYYKQKTDNASKPALSGLGRAIRQGWVTGFARPDPTLIRIDPAAKVALQGKWYGLDKEDIEQRTLAVLNAQPPADPEPACPSTQIPIIEAGSNYVQFATYIYAFVGEACSKRMVTNRLLAAEAQEKTAAKAIS